MTEEFTQEEIHDLRTLLDRIKDVALDEDVIASKIGYKGNEVIITKPEGAKNLIRKGLEEAEVDLEQ